MSVDTSNSIIKSFKNFFLGTFFSRFSGLLRDLAMAFFFGASESISAFMVAYRFANLFRRLFGETSFQAGFIPHYENLRIENKKESSKFYRDLLFSLTIFIISIIFISEIALFFVSNFVKSNQIIYLTQIMMPGLIFISLYALNSSFLQCHRNYFLAAVSPVSFNLVWIGCVVFFRNLVDEKFVYVLSVAIVLAFLFQYLTTAFTSFKIISSDLNLKECLKPKIFTDEIKKLLKPILLSIIGVGAVQINSALDSIFACIAQSSGPAYLWYSIRLYLLPLSLFAIAISSAILPPLTRAYKTDDYDNFKRFFNLGILKSFAFMMPCTLAMIVIGPSVVNLLFNMGAFNEVDFVNTSYCLFGYIIGLSFAAFVMITVSAFWAKKEYYIPTLSSVLAVVLNVILNTVFVFLFDMKSISIAVATSISSIFNFYFLLYFLKKRFSNIFQKNLFISFMKITFCSFLAAIVTVLIGYLINDESTKFLLKQEFFLPKSLFGKLNSFLILSITYLLSLFSISYLTKTKEILDILKKNIANL
jgi:putative peptidoglycan lipid II flippase